MLKKLKCPHCGELTISVFRKLCLGPAVPTTCKACGKKVGVPYSAVLAVLPLLAAYIGAQSVESSALKALFFICGGLLMALIYLKWVPLEQR